MVMMADYTMMSVMGRDVMRTVMPPVTTPCFSLRHRNTQQGESRYRNDDRFHT